MKILIATDGSEFSKAAIETVCAMVLGKTDDHVRILSASDAPASIAAEPYVGTPVMFQELVSELRNIAEKAATEAKAIVEEKSPGAVDGVDMRMGRPAESILDAAKEWDADLIVVGSHGHGFWGRALLGSVSNAVIHHASCPVLVVDNRLLLARTEAKTYLTDPGRLGFLDRSTELEKHSAGPFGDDLMIGLRRQIYQTRQGECLTADGLRGLYMNETGKGPDQRTLAHIVSCEKCLEFSRYSASLILLFVIVSIIYIFQPEPAMEKH